MFIKEEELERLALVEFFFGVMKHFHKNGAKQVLRNFPNGY